MHVTRAVPLSFGGAAGARSRLSWIGGVLGAAVVVAAAAGLAVRLTGARGDVAALLSMDGSGSVGRLFATGVLGAAGVVAALGARWRPGRRTWWAAVAVVAGALALTKSVGNVHYEVMTWLGGGAQSWRGMFLFGLLASAAIAVLWWLSAGDRRDRKRVLGALAGHAGAAVAVAAVADYFEATTGRASTASSVATFVEVVGEGLTAVALLVAVLIGVVPRLVLPEGSRLRRRDDELPAELIELAVGSDPLHWRALR